MPSPTRSIAGIPAADLESFTTHLRQSRRVLAVLGAGISASSGLPTFRGAGGLWRSYDATSLATPSAFHYDPGLVWQFYSYRRHMALNAKPNRAHYALAELARRLPGFMALSQNVDGLSTRAGHPEAQLKLLHGSLFDVRCDDDRCGYVRRNDFTDPITPALAIPQGDDAVIAAQSEKKPFQAPKTALTQKAALIKSIDISDAQVPLQSLPTSSLPRCPKCQTSLVRPGVVWFGETLPTSVLSDVDAYFDETNPDAQTVGNKKDQSTGQSQTKRVDLCLVIGTSSQVYPAAGYASTARLHGARVAVVNPDRSSAQDLQDEDWFFDGDAAEIVPEILKSVIGDI